MVGVVGGCRSPVGCGTTAWINMVAGWHASLLFPVLLRGHFTSYYMELWRWYVVVVMILPVATVVAA